MASIVLFISIYVLLLVKERIVGPGVSLEEDKESRTSDKLGPPAQIAALQHQDGRDDILIEVETEKNLNAKQIDKTAEVIQENKRRIQFDEEKSLVDQSQRSEKKSASPEMSVGKVVFEFVPKLLRNKAMSTLIIYLLSARVFLELYRRSLELRLVEKGLPKETIANVNALVYPFILAGGFMSSIFIKRGQCMRRFHITILVEIFTCMHRYYLTFVVSETGEVSPLIFWQVALNYVLDLADHWVFYFWFGHLNMVVTDYAYGSTIIGIFTSVGSLSNYGFNSFGLGVIAFFVQIFPDYGYHGCIVMLTIFAFISTYFLWGLADYLDELPTEE